MISHTAIALADRPIAVLDGKSGRYVVNLMQKLAREQGSTILLVTHDNRIFNIVDCIVYLENGKLFNINWLILIIRKKESYSIIL